MGVFFYVKETLVTPLVAAAVAGTGPGIWTVKSSSSLSVAPVTDVGRIGSGPHLVGQIGSGVGVSASFQKMPASFNIINQCSYVEAAATASIKFTGGGVVLMYL